MTHQQSLFRWSPNALPQVVMVLKKEMMKTQNKELEKAAEYRQLLVQSIHACAVRFPDVAGERRVGGGGVCAVDRSCGRDVRAPNGSWVVGSSMTWRRASK